MRYFVTKAQSQVRRLRPGCERTRDAKDSLRAGNIVIGHANYPAVTTVYDDIIGVIQDRALTTVTLADVFTTTTT